MSGRTLKTVGVVVSIGFLFATWWLLSWIFSFFVDPAIVPAPPKVIARLFEEPTSFLPGVTRYPYFSTDWRKGFLGQGFFDNVVPSLIRMFAGYAVAVIGGVTLGILLGLVPVLEALSEWIVSFARAIPPPAILGVWFILFGGGDIPKIFLIAFPIIWPILLNTIDGIQAVDEQRIQAAKVFRIPFWRQITTLYIPSASPKILAGMRITLGFALVMMLISEFIGAENGIGNMLVSSQRQGDYIYVWATIVMIALIGLVLNTVFVAIERRLMRWNQNAGGIEI